MSTIQKNFKPVTRPSAHRHTPREWRRLAVKLTAVIPVADVAYLFSVRPGSVYKWQIKAREGVL